MIGLIFGDTDFPNIILNTLKKQKIKYLIIDLSKSRKFKKGFTKTLNEFLNSQNFEKCSMKNKQSMGVSLSEFTDYSLSKFPKNGNSSC